MLVVVLIHCAVVKLISIITPFNNSNIFSPYIEVIIWILYLEESQNLSLVPEDGVCLDSTCWWAFHWIWTYHLFHKYSLKQFFFALQVTESKAGFTIYKNSTILHNKFLLQIGLSTFPSSCRHNYWCPLSSTCLSLYSGSSRNNKLIIQFNDQFLCIISIIVDSYYQMCPIWHQFYTFSIFFTAHIWNKGNIIVLCLSAYKILCT